jgi:hypothetical protein
MTRHATALIAAFWLCHTTVYAQAVQSTVTAASAEVRSAPSLVNPVIGRAPRGAVLLITRDVGDWYKISWPDAKDGVGYVRRAELSGAPGASSVNSVAARRASANASSAAASSSAEKMAVLADLSADRQPSALQGTAIATPSHVLGIGALVGSPVNAIRPGAFGFGVTARAWPSRRVGLQVAVARDALTSAIGDGRVTSTSIAPGVLIALPEQVGDFVWFRPYVGAGAQLQRSTFSGIAPAVPTSANAFGMHVSGGGELTLASAPSLAFSADLAYQRIRTTFTGFEPAALKVAVAAHWYVR